MIVFKKPAFETSLVTLHVPKQQSYRQYNLRKSTVSDIC